jgi:hypothetical protein
MKNIYINTHLQAFVELRATQDMDSADGSGKCFDVCRGDCATLLKVALVSRHRDLDRSIHFAQLSHPMLRT